MNGKSITLFTIAGALITAGIATNNLSFVIVGAISAIVGAVLIEVHHKHAPNK